MSPRERLEACLDAMRRRLLAHIYARAAAVAALCTLLITCVFVWALQRAGFAPALALAGRIALLVMLAGVAALLLWLPLRRLRHDDGAQIYEEHLPDEHGRIQTYLDGKRREARGSVSPLLDLLAADAATLAERRDLDEVISRKPMLLAAGAAVAGVAVLAAMLVSGPGYWGFGSRHLLFGAELPRSAVPLRRITVTPGNATVRRNSDVPIHASVEGFRAREAQLFVRFADQQQWERAPMLPAGGEAGSTFEFRLYAVRGPLRYYVDADGTRSPEHSVAVVDLPRIERVRLTYSYPEWTGLAQNVDETVRDIRAVAGTSVKVEVFADAPLDAPALIVDGRVGKLEQDGRASVGTIPISAPGHYQIGARVANEFVALSEEYAIDVVADEKPTVDIRKPARDWRATSIEEVPVRVEADDDFRLRDVTLRYSVNGGEWQNVQLGAGVKHTDGESLLRLEEIGREQASNPQKRLVPGDLVSYYAVARDHDKSAETDLFIVQVQPFERRFTQAQGGPSGGGTADDQGAISERQREILLATWNLQRNDERHARSRQQLEDSATMLAELQATLAQQARTLAERTRARTAASQDERVRTFLESLDRAAGIMEPASQHLRQFALRDAVPLEQQALQQLLRAEAAFREVQISMQREAAGDGAQTARNFTEMFELEMDLEKNQYESESQVSMQNARKDLDEITRKLKELAQRQEELAQRDPSVRLDADQRWKQEQLRREAEDLRKRLEQMDARRSRNGEPNGTQPRSQDGDERSASTSGDRQRRDGERQREQVAQALDSVNRALQNMRSANGHGSGSGQDASNAARAAGRDLRQALQRIDQREPSNLDEELNGFADRARRMADDQRRIEDQLHEALGQDPRGSRTNPYGSIDQRRAQELVQSKQKMAGELTQLQSEMRNAVHEHRAQSPDTTRRLGEIVRDVESSDVMYRLNRSAAEIYYGRAREAAAREGLITEALDGLESRLRETVAQAAKEKNRRPNEATPDALLAEIASLRRAVEEAGQRGSGGRAGAEQGERQRGADAPPSGESFGERRGPGLGAWDPLTLDNWSRDYAPGSASLARQTDAIGQRIRDLANRLGRRDLSAAELQALRKQASEVRRLSGDPMSANYAAMMRLIDQLELSALAAARAADGTSARTETRQDDAPRYRESVAEYYRRLGSK